MSFKKYLEETRRMYQKAYDLNGPGPDALLWYSKHSMDVRFSQLVSDINFEDRSVLDVGCGFGDIIPYIEKETKDFTYLGVDIVDDFITQAKKKYPKYKFKQMDYFSKPLRKKFNIVMTSGTLNGNAGSSKKTMKFRKEAIRKMWGNAREAIAFNMAGGPPPLKNFKDSNLFYADCFEVLRFMSDLTPRVVFRYGYTVDDFTICAYK